MEHKSNSKLWDYIPIICVILFLFCIWMQVTQTQSLQQSAKEQRQEIAALTLSVNKVVHDQELEGKRRVRDVNKANKRIIQLTNAIMQCKGFVATLPAFTEPVRRPEDKKHDKMAK